MDKGGRRSSNLIAPKKRYDPTINIDGTLSLRDIFAAIKHVCDDSGFHNRGQRAKIATKEDSDKFCTLDDFFKMSATADEFYLHMEYFSSHARDIELKTRGKVTTLCGLLCENT